MFYITEVEGNYVDKHSDEQLNAEVTRGVSNETLLLPGMQKKVKEGKIGMNELLRVSTMTLNKSKWKRVNGNGLRDQVFHI